MPLPGIPPWGVTPAHVMDAIRITVSYDSLVFGAGGRNRTDTSVRKPDFASHYGFRHDAFALRHGRFDGLDFIFTMGFRL